MKIQNKLPIESLIMKQSTTVADVATQFPGTKLALEALGIDYCCGGGRALHAELKEKGITNQELIQTIKQHSSMKTGQTRKSWASASVTELVDHILNSHHVYMKKELPRIAALLEKVTRAHAESHGYMLRELSGTFRGLRNEIEQHLAKEEEILFPLIVATDAFLSGEGGRPTCHCGTVLNPIRQMEHEHENAGAALERMRELTQEYSLPDDACPTFGTLYDALQAMERDLHEHIHLENNILFPQSVEQEATLTGA